MARSWQYPRWRRVVMQIIMALVLAGTVGLAELVTRNRNQPRITQLTQTRIIDDYLSVKLPAGWAIDTPDPDSIVAHEPGEYSRSRTIAIHLKRVPGIRSADEFLEKSHILDSSVNINSDDDDSDSQTSDNTQQVVKHLTMAGQRAVMARVLKAHGMPPVIHTQYITIAVLPGQLVALLTVDSADINAEDVDLVQQIAAGITISEDSNTIIPVRLPSLPKAKWSL